MLTILLLQQSRKTTDKLTSFMFTTLKYYNIKTISLKSFGLALFGIIAMELNIGRFVWVFFY